jgi:hypothetical protein
VSFIEQKSVRHIRVFRQVASFRARATCRSRRTRQLETELLQRLRIAGALRRIEDFDSDDTTFGVIFDDDPIRDFRAV